MVGTPDPYLLYDTNLPSLFTQRSTAGLVARSPVINPNLKTLVLIGGGQSLGANACPTLYVPTNSSVVDQMNIYDGQLYNVNGPMLGATNNFPLGLGPGCVMPRIADLLINNGKFDRVICCCLNIGSTLAAWWGDVGGIHSNRFPVAMKRFISRGIVPGMTGLTFACMFDIGVGDFAAGTSQSAMTASLNGVISNVQAAGMNGRFFMIQESDQTGNSNAIRSAQAAVVNNTTVFFGGDYDSIAVSGRQDGTHWNDTGAAAAATLVYNAMHASGAPF